MRSEYFIGTYTNWCKEYCHEQFFKRLSEIKRGENAFCFDNTDPDKHDYISDLKDVTDRVGCRWMLFGNTFKKMDDHQFHYNVQDSLLNLRDIFLRTIVPYLLIIESDVIPPADLLDRLDKSIAELPEDWGILGCLYYDGFHDYSKTGVHNTHHALSGCTVYRREVIERYPFRISEDNWAAFPDAWICHDVNQDGKFKIFNDHDIRCEHLHAENGTRQSKPL
jgi:hypothetical protein